MPKPRLFRDLLTVIIVFTTALLGCGSTKASQEPDAIAKAKLGARYETDYSADKKFVLFQQSPSHDHANRSFKYVVLRCSDKQILKEGSFRRGYVKWIDNESIEIVTARGGESIEKKIIKVEKPQS